MIFFYYRYSLNFISVEKLLLNVSISLDISFLTNSLCDVVKWSTACSECFLQRDNNTHEVTQNSTGVITQGKLSSHKRRHGVLSHKENSKGGMESSL